MKSRNPRWRIQEQLAVAVKNRLFLEWILQDKAGHPMVFTQRTNFNRLSPDVDENGSPFVRQTTERIGLSLGREHPFWGLSTDLHYLGLSIHLNSQLPFVVMANCLKLVKSCHFHQLPL